MPSNATESLGKGLGITVGTTRADLGTAPDRVPCRVRPLDASMITHEYLLPTQAKKLGRHAQASAV